jgi:hypothetical protein
MSRPKRGLAADLAPPREESEDESGASDSSTASVRDLNEDQRREIYRLFVSTEADHQSQYQLAEMYHMSRVSIQRYNPIGD